MMQNKAILVVEDDEQIRNFIVYTLKNHGFRVIMTGDGEQALILEEKEHPDMVLLDLGLPVLDGMEVLRNVRKHSELPIIIISARDQEEEKVAALDSGADDYLTKPFSAMELMARIRVGFRHYYRTSRVDNRIVYSAGNLQIDLSGHIVTLKGEELHLTPLEYDLLVLFMKHAGKVLTKKFLMEEIYGKNCGTDTQPLRTLLAGLRRKIEDNPAAPEYIITEIGVGYRLKPE